MAHRAESEAKSSEPRLRLHLVKPARDGTVSRRQIEALYRAVIADADADSRKSQPSE